jgi:hypothetical protein
LLNDRTNGNYAGAQVQEGAEPAERVPSTAKAYLRKAA